ncbi:outer membrane beta-barrel protein [Enterobacteriaceae endosymbiont of Donacia crassipes]|uniref:outer membrane beta-barrel protein n=1 Tax=Enterobacteriaceae endosymbiont of Donacia crassipes TaxID=2675776 RepID=UPI00144A2627|nr:outer membrane beta-barrel protein [Enterobacteriaceae endosymbiont of Donacia crassipes]QJC34482.1 outer membrane beta-barrel protein [Enterobacteriaceae endosymbiont of Donacia crassipes]
MKKIIIIFTIIMISIHNIANAKSNFKDYWYFGSTFGLSQYNNIKLLEKDIDDKEYTFFNKLGNGFFLGYQTNNFLGLELGLDWLGTIKKNIDNNIKNVFEVKGIQLTTNIRYPIFTNLYLYTRLGGFFAKSYFNQFSNNYKYHNLDNLYYNVSPLFSFGSEYQIKDNLSSRIEYRVIKNIGNKNDDSLGQKTNNFMFSISIIYKFFDKYHLPSVKNLINKSKNYYNNNYGNNLLSKEKFFIKIFKNIFLNKKNKKILHKFFSLKLKNLLNNINTKIVALDHINYFEQNHKNNFLFQKRTEEIAKYLLSINNHLAKKIIFVKELENNLFINKKYQKIHNHKLLEKYLITNRSVKIKILKFFKPIKKYFFIKKKLINYKNNYHYYDYFNKLYVYQSILFMYKNFIIKSNYFLIKIKK